MISPKVFAFIPCSTGDMLRLSLERAVGFIPEVRLLPLWVDTDGAETLQIPQDEIAETAPAVAAAGDVGS